MPAHTAVPQTFAELGVSPGIVEELTAAGITAPFPIQAATLPDSLAGRDVLGRGKTGSGKTLAFAIPVVDRLAGAKRAPSRPTGLILAPTRELATQIAATITPLAENRGLRVTTVFGGVPVNRQIKAFKQGVDIVVACPGRLEDLMKQRAVTLDAVRITVLDEADHMADLGFLPGVTRILAATPADGQRLLFSATLDNGVGKLVDRFLRAPVTHSVDEVDAAPPKMEHHVFELAGTAAKKDIVRLLAAGSGRRILFMRTKHHARRLAGELNRVGIAAVDLHGNLSQPARDRNLAAFAAGTAHVMVATDIAARGIHVDDLELVVHVDPPAEHKAYLHRSGRTARAGTEGTVVTLVLPEQRKDVAALLRKAGIAVQPRAVTFDSPILAELSDGSLADLRTPVEPQAPAGRPEAARSGNRPARGKRGSRGARTGANGRTETSGSDNGARSGARTGQRNRPEGAGNRAGQRDRSSAAEHAGARGTGGRRAASAGRSGQRVTSGHETGGAPARKHPAGAKQSAHTSEPARSRGPRRPRRATRPAG
ncbi:DEAD/DEAH box helicase [Nocardia flavorosea]|uniref:DEAD/DEAH box helicase n=1 Tax=Nocardia flavorosea TaxID=53429 RepID=UPI001894143F|nr:DEAD/DEAH box helicase [Nocardia flavorosea]MBF6352818.1 DEAD/DEAH box helicase [Nocardia flavorosea]